MTVKELIAELKNMPEDGVVIFENSDTFIDGAYDVTYVADMEDGTVLLESDHIKNYWEEE